MNLNYMIAGWPLNLQQMKFSQIFVIFISYFKKLEKTNLRNEFKAKIISWKKGVNS
jgi:hypothetical protein